MATKETRYLKVPQQAVAYILIVLAFSFGLWRLESLSNNYHAQTKASTAKYAQITKEFKQQVTTSQYNLCLNGNDLRTSLREYVVHLVPRKERHLPKNRAFIRKTDRAFKNNDCRKLAPKS